MKILITGGAGFIGSAVIRYILRHTDDSVINVDKLTYAGNLESLKEVNGHPRYQFEKEDICNKDAMLLLLQRHQPDAIMHLAAESHVDRSICGPQAFVQTNVVGTCHLLEAARQYWSALPAGRRERFRFHHISTDEVFGDLAHPDATTALTWFNEQSAYAPSSPYSATKAASDHLVRAWGRTYSLPVIITNCSNNYGPYQFPEKLIPLMIINALANRALPVYGKGDQIRDWLYVDDHARALYTVISRADIGATYTIGGHNEKKNIEVVEALCDVLDELRPAKVSYRTLIRHVSDRPGHDRRYAIDAGKIARELGWTPLETFDSGLRKTVEWYLQNDEWVEHILNGSYQHWLEQNYATRLNADGGLSESIT